MTIAVGGREQRSPRSGPNAERVGRRIGQTTGVSAESRPSVASSRGDSIDRLRDDVRLLGELVGRVLREQGGDALFEAVERVRTAAIAMRSSGTADAEEEALIDWAQSQPTGRLLQLVRAFGVYFHVINLAEQNHRVRTLRERRRAAGPLHESIDAAVSSLREGGTADEALRDGLRRLEVHPVFTAHPSEARRRTLLHHLERAGTLIEGLVDPSRLPREREQLRDALCERITLIWQTAEARAERPSVLHEVQSALYVLAGTVYDIVPRVRKSLAEAVGCERDGLDLPRLLRFGSWVGGDRDGNPAVTGDVTRAAARLARSAVLRRYREEVQAIGRDLSVSGRLVGAAESLVASIERERSELGLQPVPEWRDEPYRRKLGLVAERVRRAEAGESGGYASAEALLADLDQIRDSLNQRGGQRIAKGPLLDLRRRVETFGFQLAELEIRQHAERHTAAIAELLALSGQPGYVGLSESERQSLLEERLPGPPLALPNDALSRETRDVLDGLRAAADVQRTSGPRACQTYVISMSRAPSDVLTLLFLAREAGLFSWAGGRASAESRLDVVPLFETIEELRACGDVLTRLLRSRPYRATLRARGNRQQVMVGYSDSNKDGGYFASAWQTYRAQQVLAEASAKAGGELIIFHGRGGAVGRGGGPMGRAILARPPLARSPVLKVTEQGEVIFARYNHPAIAERHLEQIVHALLLSSAGQQADDPSDGQVAMVERLAERSREAYEGLVRRSPRLLEFFRQATPCPELGTLNLASRPVSRSSARALSLDDLRAIPWVFSWTQARINLPGWFGLGSALRGEIEQGGLERLRATYDGWPFFRTAVDTAQLSLGTADMATARRYAQLADDRSPFEQLEAEYDRTVQTVLSVTRQSELLERSPVLARSIRLRNPYVDALHIAQLALLRRYRSLPDDAPADERAHVLDAIHHSINGIAAGLQTTG
jgi:phosphoenolpyruvate carboxylase